MDCSMTGGSSSRLVKRCRVCGDKALGFNFNGLSCESCKAFFRRNALRHEEYSCSQNGNCQIDISTRKFCQRCRLNKCFAIGMKKELIFAREEKAYKRESLVEQKHKNAKVCQSKRKPSDQTCANKVKLEPDSGDDSTSADQVAELSRYECQRLNELNRASTLFFNEQKAMIVGETKSLVHTLNLSGFYTRKIIAFAKSLHAFTCINKDDQLIIIKEFFPEIMISLTSFNYNWQLDSFPLAENEVGDRAIYVGLPVLYEAKKKACLDAYRKLVQTFNRETEQDIILRNLIIVILMFSPKTNIGCPEYIRYQYFVYCHLLKRYLEQKYKSLHESTKKYHKFMKMMDELYRVKETIVEDFIKLDSSQLTQIMAEIYNIK